MKILLVSPQLSEGGRYHFPMGAAMISSTLKNAGHEVTCLNLDLVEDWREAFDETFRRVLPDVLGSGGMTPSFGFFRELFARAKRMNSEVVTVLGGGVLGSEPLALSALDADVGVLGEGERTAEELMERIEAGRDLLDVAGLVFKTGDGKLVRTPQRPFIEDMDSLPLADYHGFGFGECLKRNAYQSISTSRGCPFHCTFCYCVMGRGRYRFHSIGRVIDELRYLKEQFGLTQIGLIDEIFALKRERILEFCEQVRPLGLAWSTQVRVEVVDKDLLDSMREAGCTLLFYGLESMSPAILESMNKRLKPDQVAEALELTYASGLRVFGNFIFGDPAETPDTAWRTLEWWLGHRQYGINLGKIDCWPGTAIYKQALEKGIIADPVEFIEKGCPLINLTDMPRDEWVATLRRVWTCHEAMIFPAKLLRVDPDEECGSAECVCPHCKATVRLTGLGETPLHPDRGTQRLGCPACSFDFDMPLRMPVQAFSPEVLSRFEAARESFERGAVQAALDRLAPFWDTGWEHPLAAYLAAKIHMDRGDAQNANEIARRGLRNNPAAPYLLEMCAASYRRLGDDRMGLAFYRQALLVRKAREEAVTERSVEILDPCEAAFRRLFPSDAVNEDAGVLWS